MIPNFKPEEIATRGQFQKFQTWFSEQLEAILEHSSKTNLANSPSNLSILQSFYNFTLKILIRQVGTHQFELGEMLSKLWSFKNIYLKMMKEFHDREIRSMQDKKDDEYNSVH